MSDTVDYEKLLASLLPFISPADLTGILDTDGGDTIRAIISNTYDGDDDDAKFSAHRKAYNERHGAGDDVDADADDADYNDYEDGVKDGAYLKDLSPDDEFIKSIYKELEDNSGGSEYHRGLVAGYEKARSGGAKKADNAQEAIDDTLASVKALSDERCKEIMTSYDSFGDDEEKIKEFVDSLSDEEYAALYKELAKRELTPEDVVATLSPEALDVLKEALSDEAPDKVVVEESEPEEKTSENKNALARLIGSIKL